MIETQNQLQVVFRDNFVAYYRSHVAHVNIVGRNFYSDHKLLGKVYEHLQGNIDLIAELIRTTGEFMIPSLQDVIVDSSIDDAPIAGTDQDLLSMVRDDLLLLVDAYKQLYEVSEEDDQEEISNFAQDEILALNKFIWQLDATLVPQQ